VGGAEANQKGPVGDGGGRQGAMAGPQVGVFKFEPRQPDSGVYDVVVALVIPLQSNIMDALSVSKEAVALGKVKTPHVPPFVNYGSDVVVARPPAEIP